MHVQSGYGLLKWGAITTAYMVANRYALKMIFDKVFEHCLEHSTEPVCNMYAFGTTAVCGVLSAALFLSAVLPNPEHRPRRVYHIIQV